jgi:Glyoxalase-like domain
MHRSRLYGIFVDTPLAEAQQSVGFWAAALGATPVPGDDNPFVALRGALGELAFEVQAVDDAPRFHVDIETDDVAAETARLLALGATEHVRHDGWGVLRAPGGHLLCVVPVQSDRALFEATARTWDNDA